MRDAQCLLPRSRRPGRVTKVRRSGGRVLDFHGPQRDTPGDSPQAKSLAIRGVVDNPGNFPEEWPIFPTAPVDNPWITGG